MLEDKKLLFYPTNAAVRSRIDPTRSYKNAYKNKYYFLLFGLKISAIRKPNTIAAAIPPAAAAAPPFARGCGAVIESRHCAVQLR